MSSLRFKYQTLEFDNIDIHFRTLRDKQEFEDENDIALNLGIYESNWSLFGIVWPSSQVLANYMFKYNTKNKKVLEVGCGIALTSLMLNHKNVDITATDYHPEVEAFLEINTKLNNNKKIPFLRTSWNDENNTLGKFDLIIGSDILYERDHILSLSSFLQKNTKKKCEIIIVDPGRGNSSKFSKKMIDMGFTYTFFKPKRTDEYLSEPYKGKILHFSRT